jgi:hypothetical protein
VNLDDLLAVINTWAVNGNSTGVRPQGDVAPGLMGDCEVDVDDLIQIIQLWGQCPNAGACCLPDRSCITANEYYCTQQGGTFVDGSCFAAALCPNAQANDNCENGIVAQFSPQFWINDFANTDGPTGTPGDGCESLLVRDLWYRRTATCAGLTNIRVYQPPGIERVVAVYDGWTCPPGPLLGCAIGTQQPAVIIQLTPGQQYTIRVGTTANRPHGEGFLSVFCPN